MKKVKSYNEALKILEITVKDLESGELTVDDLTKKVKEAAELVKYCREQLRATEKELTSALENLE